MVVAAPEIRTVDAKKQHLLSKREREVVSAVAEGSHGNLFILLLSPFATEMVAIFEDSGVFRSEMDCGDPLGNCVSAVL